MIRCMVALPLTSHDKTQGDGGAEGRNGAQSLGNRDIHLGGVTLRNETNTALLALTFMIRREETRASPVEERDGSDTEKILKHIQWLETEMNHCWRIGWTKKAMELGTCLRTHLVTCLVTLSEHPKNESNSGGQSGSQ